MHWIRDEGTTLPVNRDGYKGEDGAGNGDDGEGGAQLAVEPTWTEGNAFKKQIETVRPWELGSVTFLLF